MKPTASIEESLTSKPARGRASVVWEVRFLCSAEGKTPAGVASGSQDTSRTTPENGKRRQRNARAGGWLAAAVFSALLRKYLERFDSKVVRGAGCHIWTGALNSKGYGSFGRGGKGSVLAHRLAWAVERGPIPEGFTIDHLCREKRCQNVEHMEVVTREENLRRKGRAILECKRGHPLSGANLYIHPSRGSRACRTCRSEAARAA